MPCVKKIFFLLIAVVFSFCAKAQQDHFVYLQTENGKPFYVKLNNKVISSSPEGYIILPGVKDGIYQLTVGFPRNEFPEENFALSVDKNNEGFLLKNFDEKGWQLFNLQTLALIEGTNIKPVATVVKKETDPFSTMLASVVKDSSILQNHEVVQAPVKINDTAKAINIIETTPAPDTESSSLAMASPLISRLLSKEDNDGLQRVYEDKNKNGADTIRIFFPADKIIASVDVSKKDTNAGVTENIPQNIPSTIDNSELTITPTIVPTTSNSKENIENNKGLPENKPQALNTEATQSANQKPANENKDLFSQDNKDEGIVNTSLPDGNVDQSQTEDSGNRIILLPKEVTSSKVNSDCRTFATNEDFLKLRKKMAAENSDEDMIKVAKKYFKLKCYSTEQIKDMSYLFLKDEGKYMFFDAAYAFTSDSNQYYILQSQLTDEYFLNRFKAMIRR